MTAFTVNDQDLTAFVSHILRRPMDPAEYLTYTWSGDALEVLGVYDSSKGQLPSTFLRPLEGQQVIVGRDSDRFDMILHRVSVSQPVADMVRWQATFYGKREE